MSALLNKACEDLNEAVATGDRYCARLLLRLLAALTTTNVVSMPSMFSLLDSMVQTAIQALEQGEHFAKATPALKTIANIAFTSLLQMFSP